MGNAVDSNSGQKPRDFSVGVPLGDLKDGVPVAGRIGEDGVILTRQGDQIFCVSALCTHYHGALADGLVVNDTVRCPLHHACFSLRTGEALTAPALDPLQCWRVERVGDLVFVREKREPAPRKRAAAGAPSKIVIVGGGAAGLAAAEMLRREGYEGELTMLSADADPPVDRPNLSKDFLAGNAPPDWMPLRPDDFYTSNDIKLRLKTRVTALDTNRRLVTAAGAEHAYDSLLLATGADPVRLDIPGANDVCYLRTFDDSRAIVARAATAKRVIVIGSSFIGLEVAASLRGRGIDVHVMVRDGVPLEKVLGTEAGRFVQSLHEAQGVVFHRGTVSRVDGRQAFLSDGTRFDFDLIVVGAGVKPSIALAEQAGLTVDRGVLVDKHLQTSAPRVYAAGDVARWPDPHSGERIRIEHWAVAQRQGQVAAKNMLGRKQIFDAVPFFWSQHFDVTVSYVGHAESWERVEIDGSLAARDCAIRYFKGDRILAVATIGRDVESLRAEVELEAG